MLGSQISAISENPCPVRKSTAVEMRVPWSLPTSKTSCFGRRYPRDDDDETDSTILLGHSKLETDAMPSMINVENHHILCFVLSIAAYVIDVCSDCFIATDYAIRGRFTYALFTFIPYFTGFLATYILSFIWHKEDHVMCYKHSTVLPASNAVFRIYFTDYCKIAFRALSGPIYWNYNAISYAFRMKCTNSKKMKKYFFCRMVECERDATLLRLVEAFIESAPQMIVQTVIIYQTVSFENNGSYWVYIHCLSILSSLISVSWSLCCQHRTLRMVRLDKVNIHPTEIIIQFLWRFFSISARAVIIVAAIMICGYHVAWICVAHGLLSLLHIYIFQWDDNKSLSLSSRCLVLFSNVFIHIFTPFNAVDGPARWRYSTAIVLEILEAELLFIYVWFYNSYFGFSIANVFYVYHVLFFIGMIFMTVYYKFLHPSRRNVN